MIPFVNYQAIEVFRRNIEFPEIYNKTVKKTMDRPYLFCFLFYFIDYYSVLVCSGVGGVLC